MDEESIITIRETSRNLLVLNRRKHRNEEADVRRFMNSLRFSLKEKSFVLFGLLSLKMELSKKIHSDTVTSISNKLKTKSAVSLSELTMLKNALIDDEANINVVLHTHGALRGLVRELTGHEVNKQCAAAGCCCNLALGDSKAGLAVAKAAGPYLVASLDNLTTELAVTSAWALGNLAGSGPKACELLMVQGAIAKLTDVLTNSNVETKDAALYALVHFAYQLRDELKPEHLHRLLQVLPYLKVAASSQLLFILSCHKEFTHTFVTEEFLLKMLQYLSVSINKSVANPNIGYIFRILANFNSEHVYNVVLNFFMSNNMVDSIKKYVETGDVNSSVLWFLGNVYKYCSNHVYFDRFLR